jgi:hypothetical protein
MRLSQVLVLGAAATSMAFMTPAAFAAIDPCKVLTAEKFGQIMGYKATTNDTGSSPTSCFYAGPENQGGQFSIVSDNAGPGMDFMLKGPGSSPPAGSGSIGGSYRQGKVIFSVSVLSKDQAKLDALVAEVKRNLK